MPPFSGEEDCVHQPKRQGKCAADVARKLLLIKGLRPRLIVRGDDLGQRNSAKTEYRVHTDLISSGPMNRSPIPRKPKAEAQGVVKDGAARTEEKRLQALRTELRNEPLFQNAENAYRRLAKEGCNMHVVMGHVGRVAAYKSGNIGRKGFRIPTGQEVSRKIQSINRQLTKLAHRVAELRGIWGLWARIVEADAVHVPEELKRIAAKLSCVRIEGFWEWFPQREAILVLLEQVRTKTGRAHYAEISALINAELVWRAAKNGRSIPEMKFDRDSLKMIVKRGKQRQAAIVRKRSEVKKRLESLSVEYSPRQMLRLDPID
jgi:hypothetical protein